MSKRAADSLVLAIDIGSSSTRTAIFDERARRLPGTTATESYSIRYASDGGAELSPLILRRAVTRCVRATLAARRPKSVLAALGTSSFWHGLLGLDRAWQPLTPIYTWADARASEAARILRERLSERDVHSRTGCMLHSSFWPAKLIWLRRAEPKLFSRIARWVSPVDWLHRELFGTTSSGVSMASGTGLYNLRRESWDAELCEICQLDPSQLPELSVSPLAQAARRPWNFHGQILPPIGDGAAGNLGSGAANGTIVAINVGTSAAVRLIHSDRGRPQTKVPMGLFQYILDRNRYVIGGAVSNAGNLRQWALRELRLEKSASNDRLIYSRCAAANDRLVALPFWAGERAPTWPDRQWGVLDGLTQATTAPDVLRVLTTSVFYRLAQILELITTRNGAPKRIIVSGGILKSITEVRILADALGRDVEIAREEEASLRGAAVYALQQLGITLPESRAGRSIKHDPELAAKHRERRARQIELEKTLRGSLQGKAPPSQGS